MMKKLLTLALVVRDDEILLGMKKRGFGEGHWNGFGGKVEPGESLEEAAIRELNEEAGLLASDLEELGKLDFSFAEDDRELEVHVFRVNEYSGLPLETEEMRPQWFHFTNIPYQEMWPDDIHWLPFFLAGKQFRGKFHFDRPASPDHRPVIIEASIEEL